MGFSFRHVPWTSDLAQYRRNLRGLDVGLCPTIDYDDYRRSRSDSKAIDYTMAGALPIVSAAESSQPWFGRVPVAKDADGFLQLVKWSLAYRGEVRRMAAEARSYVLAERTIQGNVWRWREACTTSMVAVA
jgi:hypothetical protein